MEVTAIKDNRPRLYRDKGDPKPRVLIIGDDHGSISLSPSHARQLAEVLLDAANVATEAVQSTWHVVEGD